MLNNSFLEGGRLFIQNQETKIRNAWENLNNTGIEWTMEGVAPLWSPQETLLAATKPSGDVIYFDKNIEKSVKKAIGDQQATQIVDDAIDRAKKSIQAKEIAAPKSNYTIQSGDNLWNIVEEQRKAGKLKDNNLSTMDYIKQLSIANNIKNPNLIYAGNQLDLSSLYR